jgi:hypothetical protein
MSVESYGLGKFAARRSERLGHHGCQPGGQRIVTAAAVRMDERVMKRAPRGEARRMPPAHEAPLW